MQVHEYTTSNGKHYVRRLKTPQFTAQYDFLKHELFDVDFLMSILSEETKQKLIKKALAFMRMQIRHT